MSFTPRSFSVRGAGGPIWLRWSLDTRRDLWKTWAAFSDTDRFNRAGGLEHQVEEALDAAGNIVRLGRVRELGLELRWIERIFDFERLQGFKVEREFLNGPSRGYALDVRFEVSDTGTRIEYQVAGFARWFWIRPLTWLIFMLHVRPSVGRALKEVMSSLESSQLPQAAPMGSLEPAALKRLDLALGQVQNTEVAGRLRHHLQEGSEAEQERLEPQVLAARWSLGEDAVMDGCLQAMKAGILSLRWDLLCPSCHGAKLRLERLDLEGLNPHCSTCNIRFDATLSDNVVVSFKTLLRPVSGVLRCMGNPSATPHLLARQDLQPGEIRILEIDLKPGRYRLRQLDQLGGTALIVGEGGARAVFNLEPHGIAPERARLRAGAVEIWLRNTAERRVRVVLEDTSQAFPGVTLAQLLHRPEGRDLIAKDVLPPELDVELKNQTVVMVECLGAVDLGQQALRDRVESAAPLWEQVGHRSLTLGFESPGAAFTGLTRIVGCVEFCSAMSQGSVMDIRGLGDDLHRAGLAMEQSQQALAISLPGGATLTQESSGYSEVIRCLARKNPVSRCTPGPMLRGRVDQLLEFVSPRSWHVQEARTIASPAALLGRVLRGRYRVDSHLSAGGFGTIFSAVDLETDQDVALKLLHPHLAEKKGVAQAFFNEARACMALDSPFIVRMTDFGHTVDGQLFCVMEHLLGRTLAELSPEARTPDLVIRILLDVLRGLQVVHEADLVHRDIKPSNILVVRGSTGSARGRLIDFGIALHVLEPDPATRPGELVGSAPFISPEQLSGLRPGPAADIYSVGMVFYRSLVGNYPFPDLEPLPQLMRRAAEAAPPLEESSRSALPAGLGELIDRALDRNPALRPRSATEFADELKSILGMPPVDEDSISPD